MNETLKKIAAVAILLDKHLYKKDKVVKCLHELSGMDITALSQVYKDRLCKHLISINGILGQYPINTDDDYKLVSDKDLDRLLKKIKQICATLCQDPDFLENLPDPLSTLQ